jgi:hypothetical protein
MERAGVLHGRQDAKEESCGLRGLQPVVTTRLRSLEAQVLIMYLPQAFTSTILQPHPTCTALCALSICAGAPWWSWIGGVLGAYYVIVNIIFAYKLGAGTAISVFVCSQLSMSIILDLTGLVGFQKRAFSW